jgi:hypothetical protein
VFWETIAYLTRTFQSLVHFAASFRRTLTPGSILNGSIFFRCTAVVQNEVARQVTQNHVRVVGLHLIEYRISPSPEYDTATCAPFHIQEKLYEKQGIAIFLSSRFIFPITSSRPAQAQGNTSMARAVHMEP